MAAFVLFGVLDFLVSSARPGPSIGPMSDVLTVMIGTSGKAALLGLVVAAIAGVVGCVAGKVLNRPGFAMIPLLGVVIYGFVTLNETTFTGEKIKTVKHIGLIAIAFKTIGSIVVAAAGLWLTKVLSRGGTKRTIVAALAGIGAVAVLYANASFLVGHYPQIHTQLAWLAPMLLALALAPVATARSKALLAGAGLVAVILTIGLVVVRNGDSWRRLAALTVVRGQAVQFVAPTIDPILRKIAPEKSITAEVVAVELPSDGGAAQSAATDWLDKNLPQRKKMNVLLIAIDTMRAKHAGFNGYSRNTTPNLDAVAKDAWVFRNAYSAYPTSNFAYATVFNSLYPRSTITYSNALAKGWTLPADFSMAGTFSKNGWISIGVTAFNKQASREPKTFGPLADGFDIYRPSDGGSRADAPEITKVALDELKKETRRPWLMWVHYMEPHAPYLRWDAHDFGNDSIDAYDSEIAYTDKEIGVLFDGLRKSGEFDNTIVVLFADHGEEFDEHGGRYHNTTVYEEQVRVPLFIRVPGLKGRAIETSVGLVDVAPTMFQLVGAKDPYRRQGKSLLPLMLDEKREEPGVVYSELFGIDSGRHVRDQRMVVEGKTKLIHRVQQNVYELYDLATDPGEKKSVLGSHPAEGRLLGLLAGFNKLIDEYHNLSATGEGESRPTTQANWKTELEAKIAELRSDDLKIVQAAARRIDDLLFDSLGDLLPEVKADLGEGGADLLAQRFVDLAKSDVTPLQRVSIVRVLGEMRRPVGVPILEEAVAAKDAGSIWAAIALAKVGNDKGREILKLFLQLAPSSPPEAYEVAIALAQLGDPAALPWVVPALTHAKMPLAIGMMQALDKLAPPRVGDLLSELVAEGVLKAKPALRAAAAAAGRLSDDPDAKWLALLLAQHDDPTVRDAARQSLKSKGVTDAEIDKVRPHAIAELEGYNAAKGNVMKTAFGKWKEALVDPPVYNAALRLRYARYLHLAELPAEAKPILEDVEKNAPNPIDRETAKKRLALLGSYPRPVKRGGALKATVTDVVFPEQVSPGQSFLVTLKVKNESPWPWQGGYWKYTNTLRVRWSSEKGVMPQAQSPRIPLPPGGVAIGEEITMQLVVTPADGRDYDAYPEIVMDSFGLEHANGGVIYRHSKTVKVAPIKR